MAANGERKTQGGPSRTPRLLALLVVVAAAPSAIYATTWWQTRPLAQRIADEARAYEARVVRRPVHRLPARRGNALECLSRAVNRAPRVLWPLASHRAVLAAQRGKGSWLYLPPTLVADLDAARPFALEAAGCTSADALTASSVLGPWSLTPALPHDRADPVNAAGVVLVSMATARVAAGEADAGLALCADLLALARDYAWTEGRYGHAQATDMVLGGVTGCALVIDHASAAARVDFLDELARVRAGWPPWTEVIDRQRVRLELAMFGAAFPADARASLTPAARRLADTDQPPMDPAAVVQTRRYWAELDAAWRAAVEEQRRGPPGPAVEALARLDPPRWLNADLETHPDRVEGVLAQTGLDLIEALARASLGETFETPRVSVEREGDRVRVRALPEGVPQLKLSVAVRPGPCCRRSEPVLPGRFADAAAR